MGLFSKIKKVGKGILNLQLNPLTPLGGTVKKTIATLKAPKKEIIKTGALAGGISLIAASPTTALSLASKAIKSPVKTAGLAFSGITGATVLSKSKKAREAVKKAPETFVKTATTGGDIIAKTIETGDPGINSKDALIKGGLAAGAVVGGVAIAKTIKKAKEKSLDPGAVSIPSSPLPVKSSIENPVGAVSETQETETTKKAEVPGIPRLNFKPTIKISIDNKRATKKLINIGALVKK